ncbi:DUF5813 family protein [Halopenitus salinus]|uniref:DUF5813 family protein n=1 Tax=Halopenitus salinus TaxID=1198295 RepID=A0ABD5UUJ4_9EURY
MREPSDRVRNAFETAGSFEQIDETTWRSTTTAFEGRIEAEPIAVAGSDEERTTRDRSDQAGSDADGTDPDPSVRFAFDVTVVVPMLDAVTEDAVAEVVEDGWFDTFERRIEDVSGITRRSRDLDPGVRRDGDDIVVEVSLADANPERGVEDARAFVDFVEGTYVQGIIPGYDYADPVAGLLSRARTQGTAGDV